MDESGELLATQKMKVASIADDEGLAWTVASLVQELARTVNIPVSDVASVGVGVPGTVEIRSGSINYTCNLPLRNVPLRKLFHRYLSIPLYIENDANCAALAEYLVGAGATASASSPSPWARAWARASSITARSTTALTAWPARWVTWSSSAMACPVPVAAAAAGSSTPAPPPSSASPPKPWPPTPTASWPRWWRRTRAACPASPRFIAARRGDPVGQQVCDEYVDYLACGVVNVVNIFQPDTLAIGGGVSNEAEEQLLLPVRQRVARESIPCGRDRRTRIVKAELGNRAGTIGAALLGKNKRI